MAIKSKSTTREFLNIDAADFSAEFQAMVALDRQLYQQQKANREAMAELLNVEASDCLPDRKEVTSVTYTPWGQLQAIVDYPQVKTVKSSSLKPSLRPNA